MKLNEVSVDGYGVCNNLRLQNIGDGLNVVFGHAASGKSTLVRYIRNVLFGFGTQSELGHGALEASLNGQSYRLLRTAGTDGQLLTTDLRGTRGGSAADEVLSELNLVGADVFETAFVVGSEDDFTVLAQLATTRCSVPFGRSAAFGNVDDFAKYENQKREYQHRLSSIDSRITGLESQRQELNQRIDQLEFSLRGDLSDVEYELESIDHQLQHIDVTQVKARIRSLDHEIAELHNQIDASRPTTTVTLVEPVALSDLYLRLDEIDDQIRRWRQVHEDIQQQRVHLKNEMVVWNETGMDSAKHPYHRAQEIVTAIESKVGLAEQSVGALQNVQIVTPENNAMTAERLTELCNGIRHDLYELCDELGDQFKQIRHRAATAELKRLRRCYEEIGDNIRIIVERRTAIVAEIRKFDPEGARLIDRQDQEFCRCAMHDGYLQARRRYAGPIESVVQTNSRASFESELRRLEELRDLRSKRVNELVQHENRIIELESRRSELLSRKNRAADRQLLEELKENFRRLRLEITELQKQRETLAVELNALGQLQAVTPNTLLESAARYINTLTRGVIQKLWFGDSVHQPGVVAFRGDDQAQSYESLNRQQKYAVRLGLCFAIAEYFASRGNRLPLLVDDAFAISENDMVQSTLDAMVEFCRHGNQLVATTSNQSAVELARRARVTTFDLPETSVSPVSPVTPIWKPERIEDYPPREPEFLTPYTTRMHHNVANDMARYPQVKYPPVGVRIDHQAANFDGPLPGDQVDPVTLPAALAINENASLAAIGIFDSMDVERLNRLGLDTVTQLLEIDPNDLPADFVDSHISSSQMDKWQSLCWLIICVPGLEATDARILYAIGITEPEQLETTNSTQLIERINRFLRSTDGQAFATTSRSYNRDIASRWYDSLNRTRSSWRMPSGYSRRSRYASRSRVSRSNDRDRRGDRDRARRQSNRSTIRVQRDQPRTASQRNRGNRRDWRPEREARIYEGPNRKSEPAAAAAALTTTSTGKSASSSSNLKFYLQTADDLEAAPSIGPKTAERFAKINVIKIADFLTQTAESMATKINYKRITADVIRQWQHQARLVCRIPNLRGHDAQLLVACGITEPEDLAERQAQSLFKTIEPFAKSKEGLKIIRGGKQPDLEEVTDWINWARETRSLQAA